jgi:hypothetical protein
MRRAGALRAMRSAVLPVTLVREEDKKHPHHAARHARTALNNAGRFFELDEIEEDIIIAATDYHPNRRRSCAYISFRGTDHTLQVHPGKTADRRAFKGRKPCRVCGCLLQKVGIEPHHRRIQQ